MASAAARAALAASPRRVRSMVVQFQLQWRRGRPRRLLLAALGRIQCSRVAACPCAACCSPHGRWCPCNGGTASAAARAALAASPRRAWSRIQPAALGGAAGVQRRRCLDAARWWWLYSEGTASAAVLVVSPRCAVQGAQQAAVGGAAGAQGQRRARVRCAARRVRDGGHAVGYSIISSEGGLSGRSLPCLVKELTCRT